MIKTKGRRVLAALILSGLLAGSPAAAAERLTREAAVAELDALPLYQVLAKHYPKVHDQLIDDLVRGVNAGRPYSAVTGDINAVVANLVGEQMPKANVENTVAMMALARDQANAVLAKDPAMCLSILGVRAFDIGAVRALPEELTEREAVLMAKLLKQTAVAPETLSSARKDKTIEAVAMDAYDRLSDDRLRVALGEIAGDPKKAATPLQQTAFCEFTIGMFDLLLKMPPIEGAQTFRALSAMK